MEATCKPDVDCSRAADARGFEPRSRTWVARHMLACIAVEAVVSAIVTLVLALMLWAATRLIFGDWLGYWSMWLWLDVILTVLCALTEGVLLVNCYLIARHEPQVPTALIYEAYWANAGELDDIADSTVANLIGTILKERDRVAASRARLAS